jgi:hypothetical protein
MDEKLFEEITGRPFRVLRKGDEPIRRSKSNEHQALIPEDQSDRLFFLESGFMKAAHILVDTAIAKRPLRWELTLPSLFCYRHAIELAIKSNLTSFARAFSITIPPEIQKTHDLQNLWNSFEKLLEAVYSSDDAETISAARKVVMDFHTWDCKADAFRYATDRKGNTINLKQYDIDLENLRNTMEAFENFIYTTSEMLSQKASREFGRGVA